MRSAAVVGGPCCRRDAARVLRPAEQRQRECEGGEEGAAWAAGQAGHSLKTRRSFCLRIDAQPHGRNTRCSEAEISQRVVERDRLADHPLPAELAPDPLAARFAEPGRALGIGEDPLHRGRRRRRDRPARTGSRSRRPRPAPGLRRPASRRPARLRPSPRAPCTAAPRSRSSAGSTPLRRAAPPRPRLRSAAARGRPARARRRARPSPPRAARARPGRALPRGTAHGRARVRELRGRGASGSASRPTTTMRPGTTRRGRSNSSASIPLWITRYWASLPTRASSPARRSASETPTIAPHQ